VPKEARSASIEQVISAYGLDKTYEKQQDPLLISPSSDVAYTVDDIKNAIKAASLPENAFVILAAHSGGNVGLLQTLKNSKAHHGCVILSHVKTGAIRAIANLSLKNGEYE
jgi:hypothetical protein